MALDGDITNKQQAFTIPSNPVPSSVGSFIPANPLPGCCSDFVLKPLADGTGNAFQNDTNTVVWWFDPIVTGALLKLKKYTNGAWVVLATISDNTYGKFGDFAYYVNNEGQNFISLQIAWANVLAAFNEGSYKVTCTYTIPFGGTASVDIDSYEFCLRTYSPFLADNTVRLDYWLSGVTGDITDDTKIKDFGILNIYNTLRLPGYFGYPKASYKEEDIEYNTGQYVYVEDSQVPIYKLKLKQLPFFIHELLRTDFMMADSMAITDYNSRNNGQFIQKFVRKDSGYEPKWYALQSNFATIELQFRQQYNRLRKLRN